jgi:hypothetical protein
MSFQHSLDAAIDMGFVAEATVNKIKSIIVWS